VRVRLAVRRRLPVLTAGLALVLAGCGGSDSEQPSTQPAPKPAPSTAAADSGKAAGTTQTVRVAAPQPAPGDLANFSCDRHRGVWSASGDITNSARQPMVYTVTVATVADADVAGEDTQQVLLRPGKTTSFELPAVSRGPADSCVPRLVAVPR
jgi:hypothetical protein